VSTGSATLVAGGSAGADIAFVAATVAVAPIGGVVG